MRADIRFMDCGKRDYDDPLFVFDRCDFIIGKFMLVRLGSLRLKETKGSKKAPSVFQSHAPQTIILMHALR